MSCRDLAVTIVLAVVLLLDLILLPRGGGGLGPTVFRLWDRPAPARMKLPNALRGAAGGIPQSPVIAARGLVHLFALVHNRGSDGP